MTPPIKHLDVTRPEDTERDQVRYEVHVRQQIEQGEAAIAEGRTVEHDEVKQRFAGG